MPEQALDLIHFEACEVAQAGPSPTKVMLPPRASSISPWNFLDFDQLKHPKH